MTSDPGPGSSGFPLPPSLGPRRRRCGGHTLTRAVSPVPLRAADAPPPTGSSLGDTGRTRTASPRPRYVQPRCSPPPPTGNGRSTCSRPRSARAADQGGVRRRSAGCSRRGPTPTWAPWSPTCPPGQPAAADALPPLLPQVAPLPPTNGLAARVADLRRSRRSSRSGSPPSPRSSSGTSRASQIRQTGERGDGMAVAGLVLGYLGSRAGRCHPRRPLRRASQPSADAVTAPVLTSGRCPSGRWTGRRRTPPAAPRRGRSSSSASCLPSASRAASACG